MENIVHLVSMANALLAWAVVYWLIRPALVRAGPTTHLAALTAPHLFRYLGLVALVPALFDMRPLGFGETYHAIVGYGDWISGLLALATIVLIKAQSRHVVAAATAFNLVGLADFAHAGLQLAPKITDPSIIGDLGWILFTVYLPMLMVSHIAALWLLWGPVAERWSNTRNADGNTST